MTLATLFDYATLDSETRIVVQQKTGEIRDRIKRTREDIIEIGERLIEVKERLGHGRFGEWLKTEFDWTDRTALNFMNVAEAFKSEKFSDLNIAPSALYALSAPSVPESARQEAIERASNGERVGHKEAKEIKERHKPAPNPPAPSLLYDSEEDAREQARIEAVPPEPDAEPREEDGSQTEQAADLLPTTPLEGTPERIPTQEETKAQAEKWSKFLSRMNDFLVTLPRRGGIANLTRRWSRGDVNNALANLKDLRDAADLCIRELEASRKR